MTDTPAQSDTWPLRSLKRMGSLLGGSGFPIEDQGYSHAEMELPFFKVKDLQSIFMLSETDNYISRETAARLGATIFPQGAIVFAKVGAALLLNRFRILGTEGCVDNNMMAFQLYGRHDVRFFLYALGMVDLSCNFNQGPVPSVNTRQVGAVLLPVPTIPEQKRIAAYLDASCAAIDAAVAAKRQQLELLAEMYRTELHRVFDRPDWPRDRIKDVTTKIGSGVTPEGGAASYLDEGIPFLRSQNVHFDGLRLDDVAHISSETHADMSGSQLKPHDVLLNITGASIGRCTYVPDDFGEGNVNQHVCIMRPNHRVNHRYLAAFLASPFGQSEVFSGFTGASRQGLSHKDLGVVSLPVPSLADQLEAVSFIEKRGAEISKTQKILERQIDTLTAYRKSLIHECVTGQRRITESDFSRVKAHA